YSPILQTNNLTIGYKHSKKGFVTVQKNVNIRLEKGKLISLVGINGIGKSTLLRTLSANQNSLDGRILLNDKNIQEYT
ncbi:ATP-binding cassette domain-containing protein, partial [Vibrio vulnificus]